MTDNQQLYAYLLRLGDNTLILGQRLSEWCGHGPVLEQDIAITNIALDLIGQTRSWYQYAAEVEGKARTENDIAYLRHEPDYYNVLLVEQPNRDWAYTIVRQFIFDVFNYLLHQQLTQSKDAQIAAIAQKSIKEIAYHTRYSAEWLIRLGDGTNESHTKMQNALNDLWEYSGELVIHDDLDRKMAASGIGADIEKLKPLYEQRLREIIKEATLEIPEKVYMQRGGKQGQHSEYLGFILAELQFMQRAYPNMEW